MSVPDEYSTYCDFNCGGYNVDGYCEDCLARFINWLIKNKQKPNLDWEKLDDLMTLFKEKVSK